MKRRYELHTTVAEWTDAAGKKCSRTANIGTVFESAKGRLSMKLELIPIFPGWSGFVSFRDVAPPPTADKSNPEP